MAKARSVHVERRRFSLARRPASELLGCAGAVVAGVILGVTWLVAAAVAVVMLVAGDALMLWVVSRRLSVELTGPDHLRIGSASTFEINAAELGWCQATSAFGMASESDRADLTTTSNVTIDAQYRGRFASVGVNVVLTSSLLGSTTTMFAVARFDQLVSVLGPPERATVNDVHAAIRNIEVPGPVGSTDQHSLLREYQIGDPRRSIHWRTSARLDQLMVRQPEPPTPTLLVELVLNGDTAESNNQACGRVEGLWHELSGRGIGVELHFHQAARPSPSLDRAPATNDPAQHTDRLITDVDDLVVALASARPGPPLPIVEGARRWRVTAEGRDGWH